MRVLLSAYACEPAEGSEAGIGWNMVRQVSALHDTVVLTREANRRAIESAANRPAAEFVFVDSTRLRRLKKGPRRARLYYFAWQSLAARTGRQLHREQPFDVVHHVTWTSVTLPIGITRIDAPTVLGPLGGAVSPQLHLLCGSDLREALYEVGRLAHQRLSRLNPALRRSLGRADVVLAQNRETLSWLPGPVRAKAWLASYVGLAPDVILKGKPERKQGAVIRAIYVGRLVPWKGLPWALRALATPEGASVHLSVVGDGPRRTAFERLAASLGVQDRVRFTGHLSRDQVLTMLDRADVMLFPSQHDEGGFVVAEAMARGVRPVVLGVGGPAALAEAGGVVVPVAARRKLPLLLAKAVEEAAEVTPKVPLAAAEALVWPLKREVLARAYAQALLQHQGRGPDWKQSVHPRGSRT